MVFAGLSQQKHAARFRGLGGFDCGSVLAVGRNAGGCGVFEVVRGVRRVCCDVVFDEALLVKVLSEVDGRVLSCCMTVELSLDKEERLLGSPW